MPSQFDHLKLRERLLEQFDSFADPHNSDAVMLAGLYNRIDSVCDTRRAQSPSFAVCPSVEFGAASIRIHQQVGDMQQIISCARFLVWLLESHHCRIEDGDGNDLTERWRQHGYAAFYDERLFQ
jgi:hypothetical protein